MDRQLCFALYSAMHAVARSYAPLLADLGLTYPQYLVMLVLWEGNDLSVKSIGERLHLDSGTLTPLLKRLETASLVRRYRNRDDERLVMIALTEDGRALRQRAVTLPDAMACAMGLTPDELGPLRDDLLRMRTNLIERRRAESGPASADPLDGEGRASRPSASQSCDGPVSPRSDRNVS